MPPAPCKECGVRPKVAGRHRCIVCSTRHLPIDEQVEAARRRVGMVPPELRLARVPASLWPAGQRWCASCQSFVDLADVQGSRCRACASSASHAARIEKIYGLSPDDYDALLKLQGGKCAICRARPKSKRLAVDHDHKTGAVRGLLCSRCNHDLMGAAWDSAAMAKALLGYIEAPPTTGQWRSPEDLAATPVRPPRPDLLAPGGTTMPNQGASALGGGSGPLSAICEKDHFLPIGAIRDAKRNLWRVYLGEGDPPPF